MHCKIIADPGSTHLGEFNRAMATTRAIADAGAWAVKWQLWEDADLPANNGNIALPPEWFGGLVEYGRSLNLMVFASVWSMKGAQNLFNNACRGIKFSYSVANNPASAMDKILTCGETVNHIFLSCDQGNVDRFRAIYPNNDYMPTHTHLLYCIPQYPVPFIVDFEGLFPRFDGFSSHCNGIMQDIEAIRQGASFIEKHVQLDNKSCTVPDGAFAINPQQLERLCSAAKE